MLQKTTPIAIKFIKVCTPEICFKKIIMIARNEICTLQEREKNDYQCKVQLHCGNK